MISNRRKTFLLLSAIILALTLYKISLLNSSKEVKRTDTHDLNEYKINTKPLKKENQGSIDSH